MIKYYKKSEATTARKGDFFYQTDEKTARSGQWIGIKGRLPRVGERIRISGKRQKLTGRVTQVSPQGIPTQAILDEKELISLIGTVVQVINLIGRLIQMVKDLLKQKP